MQRKEIIMEKKWILVFMIILAMGITACSFNSVEDAVSTESIAEQETESEKVAETKILETKNAAMEPSKSESTEDAGKESSTAEENIESDPITGIVKKYEDNTIIIKDPGDGMFYYFSTKNTEIIEGDSPITVGDKVEITYQGLLGNESHPGPALKIVADIVK